MSVFIHPTSIVDDNVSIGNDTKSAFFSHTFNIHWCKMFLWSKLCDHPELNLVME